MPKLKTKKALKGRFKITKNGKVLYNKMGKRHILTKKSAKRKRNLGKMGHLAKPEADRVKKMMPYE